MRDTSPRILVFIIAYRIIVRVRRASRKSRYLCRLLSQHGRPMMNVRAAAQMIH